MCSMMNASLMEDYTARREISEDISRSLYVEAGAGTGKTTSLVSRVCAMVLEGHATIGQMVIITFTRAAASELRYRVREQLEETEDNLGEDEPERRRRVRDALAHIGSAAVQTIDSFSLSLLREYPLEASMPPQITPLTGITEDLAFKERWNEWLLAGLSGNRTVLAECIEHCYRLGLPAPLAKLEKIARRFHANYDLLEGENFTTVYKEVDATDCIAPMLSAWEDVKSLLPICTDPNDKLFLHINEKVYPSMERIVNAASSKTALEYLLSHTDKLSYPHGKKDNWMPRNESVSVKEEVAKLLKDMQECLGTAVENFGRVAFAPLLAAVKGFVLDYADRRRVAGTPNFHDMLVWARNLLQHNESVREYLRKRYRFILVDEFQDTDPLQINIVRLLTDASPPGALFVVGDLKQSIYRFRRADIEAASVIRDGMTATDGVVYLESNFRSQPEILTWVNDLFGELMAKDDTASQGRRNLQADYHDLKAPKSSPTQGLGVKSLIKVSVCDGGLSHEITQMQAEQLASLALWVGNGGCQVRDTEKDSVRPSQFSDLCILVRTRTPWGQIQDRLKEKNVPFILENMLRLYDFQAVMDLINAMAAIDDPANRVAIAAALRSPAYGCSDADLFRWKQAGGRFDYLSEDQPRKAEAAAPLVGHGLRDMRKRWKSAKAAEPLTLLLEKFIRERRVRETISIYSSSSLELEETLKMLDLVLNQAYELQNARDGSLRDFIRMVEERRIRGETEKVTVASDSNALRVMTIHNAKGLEFPIVALLPFESSSSISESVIFSPASSAGRRVHAILGKTANSFPIQTPCFDEEKEEEKIAGEMEEIRLLYVGATRARDHLFISLRGVPKEGSVWESIYLKTEKGWPSESASAAKPAAPEAPIVGDTSAMRDAWQKEHSSILASRSERRYLEPSNLQDGDHVGIPSAIRLEQSREQLSRTHSRRPADAAQIGTAVHNLLKLVGPAGKGDIEELSKEAVKNNRMQEEDAAVISRLTRAALASEVLRRAASSRYWQEKYVVIPPSSDMQGIEGMADLVFTDDRGDLVVVDYKTDKVGNGDAMSSKAEGYLPQMGAYAYALETATGCKVSEVWLLFISAAAAGMPGEYPVNIEEAKRLLRAAMLREKAT